jgi:deoxyribodipyrimidine photo-lyase
MIYSLNREFSSRDELIKFVGEISNFDIKNIQPSQRSSDIIGGKKAALEKLTKIDPVKYCFNRNFLDGSITRLSAYIRHGIINLNQVRNLALNKVDDSKKIEKFIQELAWRDFWQRFYQHNPEAAWQNIEDYKTGFSESDYQIEIPNDILTAQTPNYSINFFIKELIENGFLHNHARMYLASYLIHFRRVNWKSGAAWFLHHLIDGDIASNNLSWQWIASTFSSKPYIFNLENVAKYCSKIVDAASENNPELDYSYPELNKKLFPKL